MAGEIPNLEAFARSGTGKGAARQSRRDGMVPGVVYGGGAEPLAIEIPFNKLLKRFFYSVRRFIKNHSFCF